MKKISAIIMFLSIIMFLFYLKQNAIMSYYDENGYLEFSEDILNHGLFGMTSDVRTYFYALIIAIASLFSDGYMVHIKILVSVFQYAVYVATIFFIAQISLKYTSQKIGYYVILIAGLLNPYLVQSTTLLLTDILATCIMVVAILYFLHADTSKWRPHLICWPLLATSVMIRPSSAFLVLVFIICVLYISVKERKLPFKSLLAGILSGIIFFPQLYMNITKFNDFTPLIHMTLYKAQSQWATMFLKYATVVKEGETPSLFYPSHIELPNTTIYEMITTHFPQFLYVYGSHLLGVLNWGFINTFIKSLTVDSMTILSTVFLCVCWFVMIVGACKLFRSTLKNAIIISVLYWLFIATTLIESRFGYPIFLLMLIFVGSGTETLIEHMMVKKRVVYYTASFALILIIFIGFSYWIDQTTGRIVWF